MSVVVGQRALLRLKTGLQMHHNIKKGNAFAGSKGNAGGQQAVSGRPRDFFWDLQVSWRRHLKESAWTCLCASCLRMGTHHEDMAVTVRSRTNALQRTPVEEVLQLFLPLTAV